MGFVGRALNLTPNSVAEGHCFHHVQNNCFTMEKNKQTLSSLILEEIPEMVGGSVLTRNDFRASNDPKFFLWHTLAIIRERCYGSVEVSTKLHRTLSTFPLSLCKCESNNKSC